MDNAIEICSISCIDGDEDEEIIINRSVDTLQDLRMESTIEMRSISCIEDEDNEVCVNWISNTDLHYPVQVQDSEEEIQILNVYDVNSTFNAAWHYPVQVQDNEEEIQVLNVEDVDTAFKSDGVSWCN